MLMLKSKANKSKCLMKERMILRTNTSNKLNKRWEIKLQSSLSQRKVATITESTATFSSKLEELECGSNSIITSSAVTTLMLSNSLSNDWVCQTRMKSLLSLSLFSLFQWASKLSIAISRVDTIYTTNNILRQGQAWMLHTKLLVKIQILLMI